MNSSVCETGLAEAPERVVKKCLLRRSEKAQVERWQALAVLDWPVYAARVRRGIRLRDALLRESGCEVPFEQQTLAILLP